MSAMKKIKLGNRKESDLLWKRREHEMIWWLGKGVRDNQGEEQSHWKEGGEKYGGVSGSEWGRVEARSIRAL